MATKASAKKAGQNKRPAGATKEAPKTKK